MSTDALDSGRFVRRKSPGGTWPVDDVVSSSSPSPSSSSYQVHLVPIFSDNYSYLILGASGACLAVDPADPDAFWAAAESCGATTLAAILTTHHHRDHSGGNAALSRRFPGVPVYASRTEMAKTPAATHPVGAGDSWAPGMLLPGVRVDVLETPCHTAGHVSYVVTDEAHPERPPSLFCGDTLFVGGCGRFFEGDGEDMARSLLDPAAQGIGSLLAASPEALVFCGHEYTVSNLRFAAELLPDNKRVRDKLAWAMTRREQGIPTVPSTLEEEMGYNPFMRSGTDEVASAVGMGPATAANRAAVMTEVRRRKDAF